MQRISPDIEETRKHLATALSVYAQRRSETSYQLVGQFMDREGARHSQEGVYGMAGWCLLTSELGQYFTPEGSRLYVEPLRARVYAKLSSLVNDSDASSPDPDSEAFELKYIITKICATYEALKTDSHYLDDSNLLLRRLISCRHAKGWGYTTDSPDPGPISTCIVLRSIIGEPCLRPFIKELLDCISYDADDIPNTFPRIFVLSTIARCSSAYQTDHIGKAIPEIRHAIKLLIGAPNRLPLHSSTSLNLDFFDKYRTRYFRLHPDLIALEALSLMSGSKRIYLKGAPGSILLETLLSVLNDANLAHDTYGSKMSFSTCLEYSKCLSLINSNEERNVSLVAAELASFSLFRMYLKKDLIFLLAGVCLLFIGFWKFLPLAAAGIAQVVTKTIDIIWPSVAMRRRL